VNSGTTTPEIEARPRQSLAEYSSTNEEGKDREIEMMTDHFYIQQRKFEELEEALRESQEQRQATSMAYKEISQKLTNSIPITPGPNINKPRIPRYKTQRIKL
jgi:hypothetical protein